MPFLGSITFWCKIHITYFKEDCNNFNPFQIIYWKPKQNVLKSGGDLRTLTLVGKILNLINMSAHFMVYKYLTRRQRKSLKKVETMSRTKTLRTVIDTEGLLVEVENPSVEAEQPPTPVCSCKLKKQNSPYQFSIGTTYTCRILTQIINFEMYECWPFEKIAFLWFLWSKFVSDI